MKNPQSVQKGNPHRLSRNQHIFPTRSINRFARDGGVEVCEKIVGRIRRRPAKDVLFCAVRLWDHRSEQGFMLEIENAYQRLADKIVAGQREMDEADHLSVTDYYCLWNLRQRARTKLQTFPQLAGYEPHRVITKKDTQEKLEKLGILYWDENKEIPNHILTGANLQMELLAERERMAGTRWGIFEATPDQGEFLVSDRLSLHTAVPLSPQICLVAKHRNRFVDFSFVGRYNGLAVENSENYYFGRDMKNCPVLLHATLRDELTRAGLLNWDLKYRR